MPDDVAEEKVKALQCLGAAVERVRPASIVDKKQVNIYLPPPCMFIVDTRLVCRTSGLLFGDFSGREIS
jgi:hypothetical protein